MSWLQNANVVGVFLAPPCGSASRARQIPLKKRKFGGNRHGPRPLRSDQFPNGLPNLTPSESERVSLANQLYHLTAKVVKWAVEAGCIFVVENPQFSLFWATTFWTEVAHLAMYSVFHSCQYGSARKKKTMFAFNTAEFLAISAQCPGQSSKHKHARWGLNRNTNTFATSDETAYPMGLARLIAVVFTRALLNNGIAPLPDTLDQVQDCSLQFLQKMRAVTGIQARASKMPPLVRTYKSRLKLQGPVAALPNFAVFQRTKNDILLSSSPSQVLPKGSRLLAIDCTSSSATGGKMTSEDSRAGEGVIYICNDSNNFSHDWMTPAHLSDSTTCEKGQGSICESDDPKDVKMQRQIWGAP